jgi:tRNA modification GTPase
MSSKKIKKTILNTRKKTGALIKSYDIGKVLKSGVQVAVIGAPNVGKSTLFNSLLKEERAIVTPFPGTTRDYLREPTLINGSRISLVDMAGVDTPRNSVEKKGIQKGKKISDESDGILLLLDGSRRETPQDLALLKKYCRRPAIVVLNKTDLPRGINADRVRKAAAGCPVREISALKKTGLDGLKKEMVDKFVPKHPENRELVFHLRQKILLEEISGCLDNAVSILERGQSEEIAAEEIRGTLPLIQQMTGEVRSDEIIHDIFSRFCIGK